MAVSLELNRDDLEDTRPAGDSMREYYQKGNGDEGVDEAVQMDALASHISKQWTINKDDRVKIEQEMMRLQESVNGQYDSSTINAIRAHGGSELFVPLTSMQCNAGASWLLSVLNPPGDKAFTFKPTPIPEIPQSIRIKIEQNIKSTIAANAPKAEGTQSPTMPQGVPAGPGGKPMTQEGVGEITDMESDKMRKSFNKEAAKRAERMESKVQDQLLESGWYETLEAFVTDLVTFPTAFIKTTYDTQTKMAVTTVDGQITMESTEALVAKDERVSPFDIYPSPDQNTVNDGSMIERLNLSRTEIYGCLDKPGYNNENILKVLEEVDGAGFASWQSNVDSTRRYAENHSTDFSGQDGAIYGLRFLGPVSVDKMMDWGYEVEDLVNQGYIQEGLDDNGRPTARDKYREIDIDAILIGNHVIKAVPNMDPEGKRPYYSASYRKVPGSFWGKSVAMLSQPHQRLVNATARALSNNMGIASGPQIVVYTDRLPNGETLQSIEPLKIWQMTSDPAGSNAKPIEFFQPQSNAQELMAVYQYYFDSVGEVTGIPRASYASDPTRSMPGANTASGLAMLLETASKQIKQAVRNIDTGIIEPRLQYQFRTNMMDPEVPNSFKGDMSIQAIGAKSIVAKAVENQRVVELLQATANPLDSQLLGEKGRASLYRSIGRNYDIDGLVPTEDELDQRAKEAAAAPPQPTPEMTKLEIEKIRAEVRIKDQEMENQNSEAQRQLDLKIAQMEFESKQLDLQIAQTQNQANNEAKLKGIALKEQSANARFETEVALKESGKTGV